MTVIVKLDGNIRQELGGSYAKRLRLAKKIPAVIYGEGDKTNICIEVDMGQFEKQYFQGGIETKIFEIVTPKETFKAICYQTDVDPVSDRPRHLDFISVKNKKEIKTLIPLVFTNKEKSPGLKKSGYLNVMVRKLQVFVNPNNIPSSIEIDCANLRLRQSVKISDLKLPEDVRPTTKKDIMLVRIIGRGKEVDEAATTATTGIASAATATATPAATTTATPAAAAKPNKK